MLSTQRLERLLGLSFGLLTRVGVAQVCLVAARLMANILDRVVDVLVRFGQPGGGDVLVGLGWRVTHGGGLMVVCWQRDF